MRKMKMNKFLAATSLALAVAALGCTTNRYPGNGEPTITTPGYGAANQAVRSADERAAINAPIQGTAADMMKLAMINIHREIERRKLTSIMIMQVHDELVFDCIPEEADEMMALVKELMSNAMPMDVPIEVEAGMGPTWFEAH